MSAVLESVTALRHRLHRTPELSGSERDTARTIAQVLERTNPTRLLTGVGGHGLIACYDSGRPGPRVMFRAELDALPISDRSGSPHASERPNISHACGHDGHSAMLAGLAMRIAAREVRLDRGAIMLLFQPAEETGAGAEAVLRDPAWQELAPDYAYAVHNLPGAALGTLIWRSDVFAAASRGLIINFDGVPAHAAHPEDGTSPAACLGRALITVDELRARTAGAEASITPVHCRLGNPGFGTSPADAVIMATIRGFNAQALDLLESELVARVTDDAGRNGISVRIDHDEVFPLTMNDPRAVVPLLDAAEAAGIPTIEAAAPYRWSEDFGHVAARIPSAYCCLGAGERSPVLHSREYDFPDALLPVGLSLLECLAERLCAASEMEV